MRTRIWGLLFVCVGFFGAWTDASPVNGAAGKPEASLQKVRYWCSAQYTRVVFDLDQEVDYRVGRLKKDDSAKRPARIYVDLQNTLGSKDVAPEMELEEGPVRSIRSGRFDKSTTRLVMDLRQAEDYNVFRLE